MPSGSYRFLLSTLLIGGIPAGCGADTPGEPLEVRSSKCEGGGGDEEGMKSKVSISRTGDSFSLDARLFFNCIVGELCAYKLDTSSAQRLDILLAPCNPRRRDIAKCTCAMNGTVRLPQSEAKQVRVYQHGVYRPGQSPERQLLDELELK